MSGIVITGWTPGLQVATCIRLLQSSAGLSASESKGAIEQVLRGEHRQLSVSSASQARLLVAALQKIGAIAHVEAD